MRNLMESERKKNYSLVLLTKEKKKFESVKRERNIRDFGKRTI